MVAQASKADNWLERGVGLAGRLIEPSVDFASPKRFVQNSYIGIVRGDWPLLRSAAAFECGIGLHAAGGAGSTSCDLARGVTCSHI